jgi:hypothetical protein
MCHLYVFQPSYGSAVNMPSTTLSKCFMHELFIVATAWNQLSSSLFVSRTHHRLWTVYCTSAYPELHWGIMVQSGCVENLLALDGPSSAGICNVKTLTRYHPKTRAETSRVSNASMKSVEIPTGNHCGCLHRTWSHLDYCELCLRIAALEGHRDVIICLSRHTTRSAKRAVWVLKGRDMPRQLISTVIAVDRRTK